jgi:hypothetical protein
VPWGTTGRERLQVVDELVRDELVRDEFVTSVKSPASITCPYGQAVQRCVDELIRRTRYRRRGHRGAISAVPQMIDHGDRGVEHDPLDLLSTSNPTAPHRPRFSRSEAGSSDHNRRSGSDGRIDGLGLGE